MLVGGHGIHGESQSETDNPSYLEVGHAAAVGVLGREAVGVLKGRPWLSHHVSHCVEPTAATIGLVNLMTRFSLARLMPCSSFAV